MIEIQMIWMPPRAALLSLSETGCDSELLHYEWPVIN